MSYGKIYETTWWGNPVKNGWGDVYYDLQTEQAFRITVDTTQAGSASDTFVLPLASGESYDFRIDWGDNNIETITSDSDVTHVYDTAGTYQISITGQIPRVYFNNTGDKAKLMSIDNFGTYAQGSTSQAFAFRGCSNMVINATDVGYFGSVANFYQSFENCSSLTSFPLIDTSSGGNFFATWRFCSGLTSFPLIDTSSATFLSNTWANCSSLTSFPQIDTSSVTTFKEAWFNCTSLTNIDVSNWDVSSVTNMINMFNNCNSLTTLDVSNWDVSSVANMQNMLRNCDGFDDDLSLWDITSVTNFTNFMFEATGLSTANYDATLIGWEATLQAAYPSGVGYTPTISINFGGSQYTSGGAADTARQSLINNFNWTIVDGGIV